MIQDSDNDKDGFVNYQEYKRVRRPDGARELTCYEDRTLVILLRDILTYFRT
ncbi:hypothetical protein DAPPUDRAFT_250448 [Daphnia pulex]|uniref:EF-hand domain-containing protein n=1 Tax=Daphnia pulex TaxID=6669 RepID=E9GYK6_DAPPU|nr:hypothetical protein DAPPUDRAFT_250448 [Daphnia pulex]|eukprot:EFX75469.1 hypothetical protein DAPPUDRAFT_250448 [Daphnia pulex]